VSTLEAVSYISMNTAHDTIIYPRPWADVGEGLTQGKGRCVKYTPAC